MITKRRVVEIGGLELSAPHDGLMQRTQGASPEALLPSVGAALRTLATGLLQLADAIDSPSRSAV